MSGERGSFDDLCAIDFRSGHRRDLVERTVALGTALGLCGDCGRPGAGLVPAGQNFKIEGATSRGISSIVKSQILPEAAIMMSGFVAGRLEHEDASSMFLKWINRKLLS